MSCACLAVIPTKLSRSAMLAVNCASWACRCDIWRGFWEGAVLRREDERGRFDMFPSRKWITVGRSLLRKVWAPLLFVVGWSRAGNADAVGSRGGPDLAGTRNSSALRASYFVLHRNAPKS